MKITSIDNKSPYIEKVLELGNRYSSTLGFLPQSAYLQHAVRKQIIVAINDKNEVIGYLLYNINQKNLLAYIVHLCVREDVRRTGIASYLFNNLKKEISSYCRGIRIHCRRDYEASKLWPKLGFVAINEKSGRSKHGSILTVWRFDFNKPDLFSVYNEFDDLVKIDVIIDANIYFELLYPEDLCHDETKYLMSDWLQENIELCLTSEIFNEIDRNPDSEARKKAKSNVNYYNIIKCSDEVYQKSYKELRTCFPNDMSESDESDLRQPTRIISAGKQFLITYDKNLLKKSEMIFNRFGVNLMTPSQLIIHQDSIIRESEYQPVRLAGSLVNIERVQTKDILRLEQLFRFHELEKKSDFKKFINNCLSDPINNETFIVRYYNEIIALLCYCRKNENEIKVPIFRIINSQISSTLARHLSNRLNLISSKENRPYTKIVEKYLSPIIIEALKENGFFKKGKIWQKLNLMFVSSTKEIYKNLCNNDDVIPNSHKKILSVADPTKDIDVLLKVERSIFPSKLTDLKIPSYIIPIWPEWAMHLFDYTLGDQDLFGSDPSLIFNIENVYYRSSKPRILEAPGRILWYVSKRKGKFPNTMSIRACSYLDEVFIDKPKVLYSKFKRLGIYKWPHVYKVAHNNIDNEIMAFRFSFTEVFPNPISIENIRELWKAEIGNEFKIFTPISIPSKIFFKFYRMGFKLN